MSTYTYFIADLHLQLSHPELTQLFLKFLNQQAPAADALYILGDFFEVWIGDDNQNELSTQIIQALKKLKQSGIPVFLMVGNRDFLLGKKFAQQAECTLLKDPTVINLYGQRVLLTHGDGLCTQDKKHQLFRLLTRNEVFKWLFLLLPLRFRAKLAGLTRQASKKRTRTMDLTKMDVTTSAVTRALTKHQARYLIHGHTHHPGIHAYEDRQRIVLGAWEKTGSALRWQENGEVSFLTVE